MNQGRSDRPGRFLAERSGSPHGPVPGEDAPINSAAYWDHRFATDWEQLGGREQSRIFMDLLVKHLPAAIHDEILTRRLSLLDAGCAQGDGTAVLQRACPGCAVAGFDFSTAAIAKARTNYPDLEFFVGDFETVQRTAGVVVSSNCLEHLPNPMRALRHLASQASRYVLVMAPYLETYPLHGEHQRVVHAATLPEDFDSWQLAYRILLPTSSAWSQFQVLLIYETPRTRHRPRLEPLPDPLTVADQLRPAGETAGAARQAVAALEERLEARRAAEGVATRDAEIAKRELALAALEGERQEARRAAAEDRRRLAELEQALADSRRDAGLRASDLVAELEALGGIAERERQEARRAAAEDRRRLAELEQTLADSRHVAELQASDLVAELEALQGTAGRVPSLLARLTERDARLQHLEAHAAQSAEGVAWLREEVALRDEQLRRIHLSRLWRTGNLYWRARRPLSHATGSAREVVGASALRVARMLPMPVKQLLRQFWPLRGAASASAAAVRQREFVSTAAGPAAHPRAAKHDVVCFSIIDWDFRWQRPQQLMSQFADTGHRVFFLSPSRFLPPGDRPYAVRPLRDNVWEILLAAPPGLDVYSGNLPPGAADILLADLQALRREFEIGCAVSVVQVATWAEAALLARQAFGWAVLYDCMDEWQAFPGMHAAVLAEECRLVHQADVVVVSGQQLLDKWAGENPNTVLARNAADFDHFADPAPNDLLAEVPHPIVGYFGAIAEWFDLELVERLARDRPRYQFVLLGGVFSVKVDGLAALPNVHLLGQKPYALMPAYLQHFDACIIPFRVSAITQATDPVKFYEYITQGKPVVAPQLAELATYHEHLYLASDHDDFARKLDLALQEDDPARRRARRDLARANTWRDRLRVIQDGIRDTFPKASIVIVTHDNLAYTQLCLDSLLRNTAYPNWEVVVVDNASQDGTPDYLQGMAAAHPEVKVIANPDNLGFAAATNQGLAAATGQQLVLLNNDTVAPHGWLWRLLRHLRHPEIGLVVAVTNFCGNESAIQVSYTDLADLDDFAARYHRQHEGEHFDIRVAALYCVALRRDAYQRLGPLDERFGIGMFEDDDYSHRARVGGYRVVCAEDAFVHHFGQASFKRLPTDVYQALWDRNQRLFEEKWSVAWQPHRPRVATLQREFLRGAHE